MHASSTVPGSTPIREGHMKMMAVPVTVGSTFTAGVPRLLWEGVYRGQAAIRGYDVSGDGQRLLMVQPKERPPSPVKQLVLMQDWCNERRQRDPTGRLGLNRGKGGSSLRTRRRRPSLRSQRRQRIDRQRAARRQDERRTRDRGEHGEHDTVRERIDRRHVE